jgi:hypothetical protein
MLVEEFKKCIVKGTISVIEDDGTLGKVPVVKKIDKVVNKDLGVITIQDTLDPGKTYIKENDGVLTIEEVTIVKTEKEPNIPKESAKIIPVDENFEKDIVVSGTEIPIDTEGVLVPGKKPGEGVLISVDDSITAKVDKVKQILKETTAGLEKTPSLKKPVLEAPEDVRNFYALKTNARKLKISKTTDIEFLKELVKYTDDVKLQALVSQRIEELK